MFITENQSLLESLNFLVCARLSLIEMVKQSSIEDEKSNLINFLQNEASDYQVMNLLVRGELPEEKYNHVEEIRIFSDLKEQIITAYSELMEHFDPAVLNSFIHEVDSIYPTYSSAKPVLEFQANLSEFDPSVGGKGVGAKGLKKAAGEVGKVLRSGSAERRAASGMLKTASDYWSKLGAPIRNDIAKGVEKTIAIGKIMKKGFGPKEAAKIYSQQKALMVKVGGASKYLDSTFMGKYLSGAGKAVIKGAEKAGELAKKAAGTDVAKKAAELAKKATGTDVAKKAADVTSGAGEAISKGAKQIGAGPALQKIKAAAVAAGPALQKAVSDPTLVGAGIAASALGALALYGSSKFYKRFMSKAARACGGKSGSEKSTCMKQYQVKGIMAQIVDLKKAAGACSKAKKPEKCQKPIMQKIAKLQKKASAVK